MRERVRIVYGDFFKQDLSAASVVTCYLLTVTNKKLEGKFKSELNSDTRIVSNYFTFSSLQLVSEDKEEKLFLYTLRNELGNEL